MHLTQIHNPQHTYTNKLMIMQDDDGHVVEYLNKKSTPRFWREEIQNRNRLLDFGGKNFKIEIDSSILVGRNSK
jgi:hypothetical protein